MRNLNPDHSRADQRRRLSRGRRGITTYLCPAAAKQVAAFAARNSLSLSGAIHSILLQFFHIHD